MKKNGYKMMHIVNFCTMSPNDYWHQVQDSINYRFLKNRAQKR